MIAWTSGIQIWLQRLQSQCLMASLLWTTRKHWTLALKYTCNFDLSDAQQLEQSQRLRLSVLTFLSRHKFIQMLGSFCKQLIQFSVSIYLGTCSKTKKNRKSCGHFTTKFVAYLARRLCRHLAPTNGLLLGKSTISQTCGSSFYHISVWRVCFNENLG